MSRAFEAARRVLESTPAGVTWHNITDRVRAAIAPHLASVPEGCALEIIEPFDGRELRLAIIRVRGNRAPERQRAGVASLDLSDPRADVVVAYPRTTVVPNVNVVSEEDQRRPAEVVQRMRDICRVMDARIGPPAARLGTASRAAVVAEYRRQVGAMLEAFVLASPHPDLGTSLINVSDSFDVYVEVQHGGQRYPARIYYWQPTGNAARYSFAWHTQLSPLHSAPQSAPPADTNRLFQLIQERLRDAMQSYVGQAATPAAHASIAARMREVLGGITRELSSRGANTVFEISEMDSQGVLLRATGDHSFAARLRIDLSPQRQPADSVNDYVRENIQHAAQMRMNTPPDPIPNTPLRRRRALDAPIPGERQAIHTMRRRFVAAMRSLHAQILAGQPTAFEMAVSDTCAAINAANPGDAATMTIVSAQPHVVQYTASWRSREIPGRIDFNAPGLLPPRPPREEFYVQEIPGASIGLFNAEALARINFDEAPAPPAAATETGSVTPAMLRETARAMASGAFPPETASLPPVSERGLAVWFLHTGRGVGGSGTPTLPFRSLQESLDMIRASRQTRGWLMELQPGGFYLRRWIDYDLFAIADDDPWVESELKPFLRQQPWVAYGESTIAVAVRQFLNALPGHYARPTPMW